ncbi:MAG TPA: tetratricopeptide repeat protein [Candidatus Acidoferrales bacterium]
MSAIAKSIATSTVVAIILCVSAAVSAQTTSSTRKRVPQDPAAVALNNTLAEAQAALDKKDYETAAKDYQTYLEQKPNDAAVHFQLGYALTALQKLDDAKLQYQKAIELNPKMSEAYVNLGLTLLDSDPAAAIAPLQKADELKPNLATVKFALGAAYERSGKIPEAIEQYQSAEKLDAANFDTHFTLGRLLLRANRPVEAETEFRAALAIQKESLPSQLGIAQSLLAQKKPEAAAGAFAAYLEKVPGDREARIDQASLLFDAGKYDESLAALDLAANGGPESLRALKLRASDYGRQKQFAEAVPVLQKAIALAPHDPNLPVELGHAYLEKKDYPNAVQELTVAMKANPTSLDVLSDFVAAEYLSKNYAAALTLLDILSKHEELPYGSWFIRATCYDKLGQAAPALDAYQKFLQLNKDETSDMYFEAAARSRTLKRELENKKR